MSRVLLTLALLPSLWAAESRQVELPLLSRVVPQTSLARISTPRNREELEDVVLSIARAAHVHVGVETIPLDAAEKSTVVKSIPLAGRTVESLLASVATGYRWREHDGVIGIAPIVGASDASFLDRPVPSIEFQSAWFGDALQVVHRAFDPAVTIDSPDRRHVISGSFLIFLPGVGSDGKPSDEDVVGDVNRGMAREVSLTLRETTARSALDAYIGAHGLASWFVRDKTADRQYPGCLIGIALAGGPISWSQARQ